MASGQVDLSSPEFMVIEFLSVLCKFPIVLVFVPKRCKVILTIYLLLKLQLYSNTQEKREASLMYN